MLQIGYRIHIRPEWVVPLVESYGHFFQTIEVKATEKFMKDVYIQSFVAFAKKMGVERLSFQLPNKVFLNEHKVYLTQRSWLLLFFFFF